MSPILIRPVREQLEHDRIIRLLESRWREKYQVDSNVGDDRKASVKVGPIVLYPDLVLWAADGPRKLQGVVEIETGESVNNLEAMAQWTHFGKAKVPFHLYVPTQSVEIARRLCEENGVVPSELWSYYTVGEQIGFTLVERPEGAEPTLTFDVPASRTKGARPAAERAARPAPKAAPPPVARPASAKPAPRPRVAPGASSAAPKAAKSVEKTRQAARAAAKVVPAGRAEAKAAKSPARPKGAARPAGRPAAPAKPTPRKAASPKRPALAKAKAPAHRSQKRR